MLAPKYFLSYVNKINEKFFKNYFLEIIRIAAFNFIISRSTYRTSKKNCKIYNDSKRIVIYFLYLS